MRSLALPQDFGSITILWSQPVAALQILTSGGEWRWIRHLENALVGGYQFFVLTHAITRGLGS